MVDDGVQPNSSEQQQQPAPSNESSSKSDTMHLQLDPLSASSPASSSPARRIIHDQESTSLLLTGDGSASGGLFNDVEDDPQDARLAGLEGERDLATPRISTTGLQLAASPSLSFRTTVQLPRAPHLIPPAELQRRLDEQATGDRDLLALGLAQELSRQLTAALEDLAAQQAKAKATEKALLALLQESIASGAGPTQGMLDRALLRASAEAAEQNAREAKKRQAKPWKAVVALPGSSSSPRRKGANCRLPLDEDLQDAMSEADYGASPSSVVIRHQPPLNPAIHSQDDASPNVQGSNASLSQRRGRQASTSLSTRLLGSFSPSSTSHLSPVAGNFTDSARSSATSSPAQTAPSGAANGKTKPRADSIRSVQSSSSMASASNKGITGWAGSLLGWKQPGSSSMSGIQRPPSESEDEAEASEGPSRSRTPRKGTMKVSSRQRASSRSSGNAASILSAETAASGLSLTAGDDTGYSSPSRMGSPPSQATTTKTRDGSSLKTDSSSKGTASTSSGPVRTLLQRRTSAQHSNPALSTEAVLPVSAAASSDSATRSADLLHSISESHIRRHLTVDIPETTHFRAVSESASTIGKSQAGKLVKAEVFRTPGAVSDNVSEWTQRLLASFAPPTPAVKATPSEIISRSASSSSMSSTSNLLDPNTSATTEQLRKRSRSPRLAASKSRSKAALLPALLQSDAQSAPVRLPAVSPTEELTASPYEQEREEEAMPLAAQTVKQKEKGYLASAKGTIGRALGYSSSSSPNGSKRAGSVSSASKAEKRRHSLKTGGAEPTVTLPETFIFFSSASAASTPVTATAASASASHALKVPKGSSGVLEMGTIVKPEAKPPTLAADLSEQMKDGPLVDRFGFVYDVKAGMKLLREARKRQQQGAEEPIMDLDTAASPPVTAMADVDVAELKEALGPSPSPTPALSSTNMQLTLSDDSAASIETKAQQEQPGPPSNQSIKRLLGQLGEMNENVENAQRGAWDGFIKRRKAKISKVKAEEDALRKKQAAARKAKATTAAPLGNMASPIDDEAENEQFTEHLVGVASMGQSKEDDKAFRQLVKAGIPIVYRPAIWAEVSGASELREPGLYQDLLARHAGDNTSCLEQIDMDTHRTFPTNVFFAGNGPGVAKLRRVLVAYSWRDPSIGYCQGMNLLAALLLLVYPDEEDAFWMLCSMLERVLPSDYYSSQLLVSQADQKVLQDLIQLALPDLYAHLEDLGVDLPAITFGWFLSLFTDALPIHTLLRVWDVLLVFGPITLFKVAIAIFKIHSAEILATDSASTFYVLITSLTSHMYGADKLLKVAFEDLRFIKRQDAERLRLKHVAAIEKALQANQSHH